MISRLPFLSTAYTLLRHSRVTREQITAFRNQQLRRLVAHAYENVPHYRRLFDQNGLTPHDIRSVDDLAALPITSRRDLQSLPEKEIVARGVDPKRLVVHVTSGSSGEPLTIRRTWLEERILEMLRLRAMRDIGLQSTDRRASVVLAQPTHPRDSQLPLRILQTFGLYRRMQIHCLLPEEDIVRALRNFRPDVLTGFAGVLSRVAQSIGEDDRLLIRPRFVVVGGEVLTPLMRQQIAQAFAAPVFDSYGSHEFKLLAWECSETGEFHTCDDSLIIEVLRDDRPVAPGERGEVVGTALHSFAMPFIRYRLGDVVTKGSATCQCGRPFSTLRDIQGRMIDYFPLPSGRVIHPYEIVLLLIQQEDSWIRQYQLIQERTDRIVLRVVPSTPPPQQQLVLLEKEVSTLLGQGVEFHISLVPEIRLEPNGKFRVSRSLVQSAYDGIDWDHLQISGHPLPTKSPQSRVENDR